MTCYLLFGSATPIYFVCSVLTYFIALIISFPKAVAVKVYSVGLFYVLGAISELLFYYIYVISMRFTILEVQQSITLNLGPLLFTYFLTFALVLIIKNTKSFVSLFHQAKSPLIFTLMGISPIIVIVVYFSFLKYLVDKIDQESIVLISIFSIILFLALFILFVTMYASLLSKSIESKYNYEYAVNVKSLLTDLKEFKHDFNNMLNGFNGCILNGDVDQLREYCKDWGTSFIPANPNIYNLGYIQNPAVLGLFLQKLDILRELKTEINILADVNFDTIMDMASLCRIIGIVLDNAIEASIESNNKMLVINIFEDDISTTIIIKNSHKYDIDINNIYKSSKGDGRGNGLHSMARILSKYKEVAHSFFIDDENLFTQQFNIPRKKQPKDV